jgi:hypothetical protein
VTRGHDALGIRRFAASGFYVSHIIFRSYKNFSIGSRKDGTSSPCPPPCINPNTGYKKLAPLDFVERRVGVGIDGSTKYSCRGR